VALGRSGGIIRLRMFGIRNGRGVGLSARGDYSPERTLMAALTRRSFLAAAAAALVHDPERALWVPGAKLISIPAARPVECLIMRVSVIAGPPEHRLRAARPALERGKKSPVEHFGRSSPPQPPRWFTIRSARSGYPARN